SDGHPGERTYTIRTQNLNLPAGVEFFPAVPSQGTLRLDRLYARTVKVVPRYSKNPPNGYRLKSFHVTPSQVRIRGPEEHLGQIDQVMTDPIDLSSVVSESEFRVHVNLGDPQMRLESSGQVTVRVQLEKEPARN